MRPIFDTTYKVKEQVKILMCALHHELVLFQKSRNCFRYAPENEIEGDILGWTTSYYLCFVSEILIDMLEDQLRE